VKARSTGRFDRSYANAPARIRKLFDQKLVFLLQNLRHLSLRAKKYDDAQDIWQARVNGGWRFYFRIEGDTYHLLDIMPHPK
jgi:plasmid maintenance system killer protein